MTEDADYEITVWPGRVVLFTFNRPAPVLTKVYDGEEISIFSDDYMV
jgi:hypothetical protein